MANVVASTHRQAPLDHELLDIGEPLRPLKFRTRPLHVMSRWRPIWRRNLVALQERRPGRANSFLHSRVSQLGWSTERGKHATRLQQRSHARPPTLWVRPMQRCCRINQPVALARWQVLERGGAVKFSVELILWVLLPSSS